MTTILIPLYEGVTHLDFTGLHQFLSSVPEARVIAASLGGAPIVSHGLTFAMVEISEAEYDEMTAVNSKSTFFFIKDASKNLNDNGKICTSRLGAFTPFYAAYAGTKAPMDHACP